MDGKDKKSFVNIELTNDNESVSNQGELQFNEFKPKKKPAPASYTQNKQSRQQIKQQAMPEQELKMELVTGVWKEEPKPVIKQRGRRKVQEKPQAQPIKTRRPKPKDNAKQPDEKGKEPQKAPKKNKKLKGILIMALALIFVATAVFGVYCLLTVKTINVNETKTVSEEYVIELSRIRQGEKYFSLDVDYIERSIEAYPKLEFKGMDFELDGTLTLNVYERTPVAQIQTIDGFVVIDKDANAIDHSNVTQKLPLIEGIELTNYSLSHEVRTDDDVKLMRLCVLLNELNLHGLTEQIDKADARNISSIKLHTNNGMTIIFGDIEDAEEICIKMKWVDGVLSQLYEDGIEKGTVDVTAVISQQQATYIKPEQKENESEVILNDVGDVVVPLH